MDIKQCKGCSSRGHVPHIDCLFIEKFKDDHLKKLPICPCQECLVKAMCNNICDKRSEYMNYVIAYHIKRVKNEL